MKQKLFDLRKNIGERMKRILTASLLALSLTTPLSAGVPFPLLSDEEFKTDSEFRQLFIRCSGAGTAIQGRLFEHLRENPNDSEMRSLSNLYEKQSTFFLKVAAAAHQEINPNMRQSEVESFVIASLETITKVYVGDYLEKVQLLGDGSSAAMFTDYKLCRELYSQM